MSKKILLTVLTVFCLASCNSDDNKNLIGYWEVQGEGMYWHPEVIEITKDGGAYRYLDAVSFEKTEYQAILKKEDGRLILDTRFVPGLTVSLLEDDLYLLIGQRKFRRSEESRIPEVRQYLELEKQRKEQQLKDLVNSVN